MIEHNDKWYLVMKQINDLIGYKNVKIVQDSEYFKFSLDSVLLANFVTINLRSKLIIDLCTGNAPIPIIIALKKKKEVIGIEIQKEVYELAKESISINNLSNKITIINNDVKNLYNLLDRESVDVITCNPPYFKLFENSIVNKNDIKSIARHEIHLNLDEMIHISSDLLKIGGIISFVHRPCRLIEAIMLMKKYNIEPKRCKFIYPKYGSESNILLIEGIKGGKPDFKIESPLYVYDEKGNYTRELCDFLNCQL